MILFYGLLYAGAILFGVGSIVRAVGYARQPIHLRWEIYPVPQGKRGQLGVMVPEILFLKGLWEFNRPMWAVSYPFHLGLYLVIFAAAMGVVSLFAAVLLPLSRAAGILGLLLVLGGSMGLLAKRLSDRKLKIYTTGADIFNLLFFAATSVLLLAGFLLRPAGTPGPLRILRAASTFDTALKPPALLAVGMAAGALLAAYIPMTHMAHFIAKYFTYHDVRWDERSNVAGGTIQKKMAEYLMYRPTWAARHVGANGRRTWVDIATTNPTEGGAK